MQFIWFVSVFYNKPNQTTKNVFFFFLFCSLSGFWFFWSSLSLRIVWFSLNVSPTPIQMQNTHTTLRAPTLIRHHCVWPHPHPQPLQHDPFSSIVHDPPMSMLILRFAHPLPPFFVASFVIEYVVLVESMLLSMSLDGDWGGRGSWANNENLLVYKCTVKSYFNCTHRMKNNNRRN